MARTRGRLALIGLGLYDDQGITVRGLAELGRAQTVFAESYTSTLAPGSIERLALKSGKEISLLGRGEVEDASIILSEASKKQVALIVPGDPMTATTHTDLRLRAAHLGIETVVVNGVSALTAVPGLLGLQHYKFGRTTTIPFPSEGYSPTSPYDVVRENLSRGLHTLVLLDIDAENANYMTANQGLNLLMDMERRVKVKAFSDATLVCVVARAGHPDAIVKAGQLADMAKMEFGPPLHTVIVPGKLHFMEEDALKEFAGWTRDRTG